MILNVKEISVISVADDIGWLLGTEKLTAEETYVFTGNYKSGNKNYLQ